MTKLISVTVLSLGALMMLAATPLLAESGRIYGKLYTVDDEVFEGWIRWDKNEAFWDDAIDGTCERDRIERTASNDEPRRYKENRKKTINFFGISIGDDDYNIEWSSGSSCELQFGHLKTMYIEGGSEALMLLKSGEEVEFSSGGDLGSSVREILLSDPKEGEIIFDWDDVDKIEFMREPQDPTDGRQRLYGRLSTRGAGEFTGWIEWDVDEVLSDDVLDGDEKRGRRRKIPFDRIGTIERRSSSSSLVILKDGKEYILRGTNDVNSDNNGIYVKTAALGRVRVGWSDFEKVEFLAVPESQLPNYDDFDGGRELRGTVTTEDDHEYTGTIVWDNDEHKTWEHLNGEFRDLDMDIPFSAIASIEKDSYRGAVVTLKNGDSYLLKGSNDVDDDNRGIFVTLDNGDVEEVDWYDFARVVFE